MHFSYSEDKRLQVYFKFTESLHPIQILLRSARDTSHGAPNAIEVPLASGLVAAVGTREGHPSRYNQMLYINGSSAVMTITWLLPTGQLTESIGCARAAGKDVVRAVFGSWWGLLERFR